LTFPIIYGILYLGYKSIKQVTQKEYNMDFFSIKDKEVIEVAENFYHQKVVALRGMTTGLWRIVELEDGSIKQVCNWMF